VRAVFRIAIRWSLTTGYYLAALRAATPLNGLLSQISAPYGGRDADYFTITTLNRHLSAWHCDGIRVALRFLGKGRMNTMRNLRTAVGGAILTFAFIFGISVAAGITAEAQNRNDRRDRDDRNAQNQRRDRDNDSNQTRNRDWRQDRNQNQDRARRDRDARNRNYGNNGRYNNGGYNNGGYNNGTYNNGGYNNGGYNNGGYNNGSYGNYGNQGAQNQGYQYGLQTGASDAQRGQSYSPQRSHYYQQASSQAFRNGFVQGYNQGYRQYGGNGNGNYGNNRGGGILGGIFGRP
jgi:hypothetical protein